MTSTNRTIDDITRRLKGRYLATIDNVTGIPGQAPAIVVTWSDEAGTSEYEYDNFNEYLSACEDARSLALCYSDEYDIVDNTL